ncbi:TPA: common pilus major fimbrillin subunit EcpA [Photobacterium damselae]
MSKYNKIAIAVLAASAMISGSAMAAAPKTATAVATWAATAIKDTTSDLVVTPTGSLQFDYAPGLKSFNTTKGLFEVSVIGDTATSFTLTAEPVATRLTHLSNGSVLNVGIEWYGEKLAAGAPTTIIDTAKNIDGNGLASIATGAIVDGGGVLSSAATDSFKFSIASAEDSTGGPISDLSALDDGVWNGDVSVKFIGDWVK